MTKYARGANFERAVKKQLEKHDCVAYVLRSAGSKGKIDLIALRKSRTFDGRDALLIQCKIGGAIETDELIELGRIASQTRMAAAVVSRGSSGSQAQLFDKKGNYVGSTMTISELLHSYCGWTGKCQGRTTRKTRRS